MNNIICFSLSLALPLPWLYLESPTVLIRLHSELPHRVFITVSFAGRPYVVVQSQALIQQSLSTLCCLQRAKSRAPMRVSLWQNTHLCATLPGTRDISCMPRPCIDTESLLHVTQSSEVLSLVLRSFFLMVKLFEVI